MATFSKKDTEKALAQLQNYPNYIAQTYQHAPDQFEIACLDRETDKYYVLTKRDSGQPWWNQAVENKMPTWWNANSFGNEDFCQEDIDAAADYISS